MIHFEGQGKGLCLLVWIACLCLGCGKAEYDQLVQKRIAELRSGGRWQAFTSDRFSFVCEFPAAPTVTPTDTDEAESEKVDAAVGSAAYEVYFMRGTVKPLDEAAVAVREQFESSKFQLEGEQEDANVGGKPAIRFRFVNNESGNAARVQVSVLSSNRSCTMSVVGAALKEADVTRFFDSFSGGSIHGDVSDAEG